MMAKTFYSEYITHCLHFYINYPKPRTFRSKIDKENWISCDKAMNSFTEEQRQILSSIYSSEDRISDRVYKVSKATNISPNIIWKWIGDLERKVAIKRGLL